MGRKFQCQECKYQATEKGNLKKHQQFIHMRCPESENQVARKIHPVTHLRSMHVQVPVQVQLPEIENNL